MEKTELLFDDKERSRIIKGARDNRFDVLDQKLEQTTDLQKLRDFRKFVEEKWGNSLSANSHKLTLQKIDTRIKALGITGLAEKEEPVEETPKEQAFEPIKPLVISQKESIQVPINAVKLSDIRTKILPWAREGKFSKIDEQIGGVQDKGELTEFRKVVVKWESTLPKEKVDFILKSIDKRLSQLGNVVKREEKPVIKQESIKPKQEIKLEIPKIQKPVEPPPAKKPLFNTAKPSSETSRIILPKKEIVISKVDEIHAFAASSKEGLPPPPKSTGPSVRPKHDEIYQQPRTHSRESR